jgi:dihydroorotate dehydrogenase (NAD+) catalytic subunit
VNFSDPSACTRVLREFTEALDARGVSRVSDIVGAAHRAGAGV